ncbi:MAG: PBP1A family penicillin-binding protein, partial [Desulfuromonadales bacterium]|nr:PBP1A family penicillin-binding protein [Desulfuromonadales bacterium]
MSFHPLIRYTLWVATTCFLLGSAALVAAYFYVAATLPRVETLEDYRPPLITRVYSDSGAVIAEFYKERRIVIPVERMPQQLVQAFVAAEDSKFFDHQGIDFISILRAAMKNVLAGGIVQGGSTITQQVAKSLLLTPEKKFSRKFKEAILAWRMERHLSKQEILALYLNQIYLGHGAYGVQAAAENYYAKDVENLSLAECAMLAGLPQAPSRYSPYKYFDRARERQKYVLGRMAAEGYITQGELAGALDQQLIIHPRVNTYAAGAVYFTEQVRRYLEETYGQELLYTGGLEVYTTMSLPMQQAAQKAVQDNLREHDRRRGYRGALRVLTAEQEDAFLAGQVAQLGDRAPGVGMLTEALLTGGNDQQLTLRLGLFVGSIEAERMAWAGRIRVLPRGKAPATRGQVGETRLPIGSVVLVRIEGIKEDGSLRLALEQRPEAQGALLAVDPRGGEVKAMVGGYDFADSQFNRAIQARRLPGSAIKPLIYAAALDKGYTPATIVLDTPVIYKQRTAEGERNDWKPKNYSDRFSGPTSVRQALALSNNVITIKILEDIGVGYAVRYARNLGIQSPMAADLTFALGSSAVTPLEMATAFSVFANGGVRVDPVYLTRVVDRDGRVLESIDAADFPGGPDRGQRLVPRSQERVLSPETAYLVTNMLESAVQIGTGQRAKALGRPTAGKTGTTNDLKDAWFVGYVPQLVAVSWVGFDQERPLGDQETGARAALPSWLAFMQEA